MAKYIHNYSGSDKTYRGKEFPNNSINEIPVTQYLAYTQDMLLVSDVSNNVVQLSVDGGDALNAVHSTNLLFSTLQEVMTQAEKDDKGLRTWCAFGVTDESGMAEFSVPVPAPYRFIAFGDAEFEIRTFGDHISEIRVEDRARLIAWGVALAIDAEATEPVADAFIQAMPAEQVPGGDALPNYPLLGAYEELKFPAETFGNPPADPHVRGIIKPGMAMTFKYGMTESTPVGGYGKLPGQMYFVIKCQKDASAPTLDGQTGQAGYRCQISIDWAEEEV